MHAETSREDTPVSKVLILETGTGPTDEIKAFCDAHNLVGLKVHKDSLGAVSRTNVDLGGRLYSDAQHTPAFHLQFELVTRNVFRNLAGCRHADRFGRIGFFLT
jgi:hypothetical protein